MNEITTIQISDFDYNLPDHRIARYPLEQRDQSKLLLMLKGKMSQDYFYAIGKYLPSHTLLVSNETKVIRARLRFQKTSGSIIELFCLEPDEAMADFQLAFSSHGPVVWKCLVGNSKRWKSGMLKTALEMNGKTIQFEAMRLRQMSDHSIIKFSWDANNLSFGEILQIAGDVPLPPYLNRNAEKLDQTRYQTVFARNEGSVAAPTAGLHFTQAIIDNLLKTGIEFEKVTLHVGAGTFKPVSTEQIGNHEMHAERIFVTKETIKKLIESADKTVIAVGTTSMRTLESLYWIGCQLNAKTALHELHLKQWAPYETAIVTQTEIKTALQNILDYLQAHQLSSLAATTALMIAPGYRFRIVNGLITNFHQPKSTLLLLVSALIGEAWKDAYQFALENDFRFLSYGDSCLFLP